MEQENKWNIPEPILVCWYSELNYYFTKYGVESIDELDNALWYEYGVTLLIL